MTGSSDLKIRESTPVDAASIMALLDRIHGETPFTLYEACELSVSVDHYAARMSEGIDKKTLPQVAP